jgi:hypothetical protein
MSITTDMTLRARIASNRRWALEPDRKQATKPARDAFRAKFVRQVDPKGKLDPVELDKRVRNAMTAYYLTLARKSVKARARKAAS